MSDTERRRLAVFQIEPSMFTPPYAEGLDEGLSAAHIDVTWITRPARKHETLDIQTSRLATIFYRGVDGNERIPKRLRGPLKGISHVAGLASLLAKAFRERPDIIHYQWTVIPLLDIPVLLLLKAFVAPVVFTAHNTVPYHGDKISTLQNLGADWALRAASHIIVHTQSSRSILEARDIAPDRISVVPHGPHYLKASPSNPRDRSTDPTYTMLLFGNLKPYKGLDLLVEAVSMLSPQIRAKLKIVVAGQMHIDRRPIMEAIERLGLVNCFQFHLHRQSEQEMADLFDAADAFVFPYRFIDASGVYYYVKPLKKWMIASRIGVFAEDVMDGVTGTLVEPADTLALSQAIEQAVTSRPEVSSETPMADWRAIGEATKSTYLQLLRRNADEIA